MTPLTIDYTNWKGERRTRNIIPQGVWFGVSEFHETEQWFIRALDADRSDRPMRDFAVRYIHGWGSPSASRQVLEPQPEPVKATGDVWTEVMMDTDDLQLLDLYWERRQQGIRSYGTPLQRDNGRDHMADAIQELADAVVYLWAANRQDAAYAIEVVLAKLLKEKP